jgi:spore coat polysaccharide biosynthesis protein SpsF
MKTVGIVQARMTSTRLPGKILMEVLEKPLLQYEIERLRKIPSLDEVVLATTVNAADDPVAALGHQLEAPTYRGSEFDVLSRYCEAAVQHGADAVVRFTADCPLIDPRLSESVIRHYLDNTAKYDYCSADVQRSYPRGVDTEVFSMSALKEAHAECELEDEREHVTLFIRRRPERYRLWSSRNERGWGRFRLTVDTPEDFELVKAIIERLYPVDHDFGLEDIIDLLERNPELVRINGSVKQKTT